MEITQQIIVLLSILALGAASAKTDIDLPTMAYASVYPVALIFKIILGQALAEVL